MVLLYCIAVVFWPKDLTDISLKLQVSTFERSELCVSFNVCIQFKDVVNSDTHYKRI